MTISRKNFDALARIYAVLEFVAFGRDLERVRFVLIDELRGCREILVLGEGDGRALVRLLKAAPQARIHCIDLSRAMLERAAGRLSESDRQRVTFQQADVLNVSLPSKPFDAVTTVFFLDCFRSREVESIVKRLNSVLHPRALWLFVDFAIPDRGYARVRAQIWLKILFAFFRWTTGISANSLPASEQILLSSGWQVIRERSLQHGLLRAVLFRRRTDHLL